MVNPILQQISNPISNNGPVTIPQMPLNNQQIQQLKGAMGLLQNSNNPQALIQNMMMQNPQMKNISQALQSSSNTREAFEKVTGINGDTFLQMLRQ